MNDAFRALADPTRRRVLQLLRAGPLTAGELADQFNVAKSTMSAHFAILLGADLIDAEKRGRSITYRLRLSVLEDLLLGFTEFFGLDRTTTAPEAHPTATPSQDVHQEEE
jgi:DNA-binding transcriptional ArsR family regulator